jgi:hypothetical protein
MSTLARKLPQRPGRRTPGEQAARAVEQQLAEIARHALLVA